MHVVRRAYFPLAVERAYLQDHQAELTEKYPDKYLVIQGETVYGAYDTYDQGVQEGVSQFGAGPFLVRSVLKPEDEEIYIPVLALGVPLRADS